MLYCISKMWYFEKDKKIIFILSSDISAMRHFEDKKQKKYYR